METTTSTGNLFDLQIDAQSQSHLVQTARWAKFLSIVGFVFCGIILVWGVFAGIFINSFTNSIGPQTGMFNTAGISSAFILAGALLGVALYFFPCLFLFRFSTKMKKALAGNDQVLLTNSFGNLKSLYKYIGILTIIGLSFFALEILFTVIFAASFSR